jgi:hypothetical protein
MKIPILILFNNKNNNKANEKIHIIILNKIPLPPIIIIKNYLKVKDPLNNHPKFSINNIKHHNH